MPYKSEKIKLPREQDRRVKLTDRQREEIKELYGTGFYSLNDIAKKFGCSKKTVLLIVNEESAAKAKQYRKEHWKDWQRKGEEHNKAIKNTRRYKNELYKSGKLKDE
jgi:DNA invertase Pin-like site-specific DNA recombinase